jgi:hypothetical protein
VRRSTRHKAKTKKIKPKELITKEEIPLPFQALKSSLQWNLKGERYQKLSQTKFS